MQDLLYKISRKGALIINAVITRSRKDYAKVLEIRKALIQFYKAEAGLLAEQDSLIERSITDKDSEDSLELSGSELGYTGLVQLSTDRIERVILRTLEEKVKALKECYYNPLAGYFGARKTQEKVLRQYVWKGISKDIADYCNNCLRCKRLATAKHKLYSLLAPLLLPIRA
jgi:hypothetical protein